MSTHQAKQVTVNAEFDELINVGMQAIEDRMRDIVNSEVSVLRDASNHILDAGGKRIRPRLLMLAYIACGGTDVEYAASPAASVELMHTASVVHDDINDHGVVRRGRPSVNAIWGRTFALLTGDFLFTAVYSLLSPYRDLNVVLSKAARALVEGETLQAWAVKNSQFTSEIYTQIIGLKTAALFEASGEMGARLANAPESHIEALKTFGYNIGLSFQIVDDILDIVGDEETLGKTAGIDITQGRGFASVDSNVTNDENVVTSIKQKLLDGDRLEKAQQQSNALVDLAIAAITPLPDSDAKDELIKLAKMVVNRDH